MPIDTFNDEFDVWDHQKNQRRLTKVSFPKNIRNDLQNDPEMFRRRPYIPKIYDHWRYTGNSVKHYYNHGGSGRSKCLMCRHETKGILKAKTRIFNEMINETLFD